MEGKPAGGLRAAAWHPASSLIGRVLIGGLLLYTGWQKVGHGAELARVMYGYRLLDPQLLNLAALCLPWVEVLAGVSLVTGLLRRSGALVATGLFALFALAVWLAILRGIQAPCGCFTVVGTAERIGWAVLLRDIALLAVSLYLVLHPSRVAEADAWLGL